LKSFTAETQRAHGNPQRELTERIIGAGIEVHRVLGPGLLESVYQEALESELRLEGLAFSRQESISTFRL
jgi:GxxExxY protein